MTKADRYLIDDIRNILDNGYKDINPRPVYADGTPAYTISVNHVMRKYDLSKGEFPVCTLRPQAWKTGIREIFTIYQKPTNVLSEMKEMGVTWWDPWGIGDGTIGQRYGATVKRYDLINNLIRDIRKDPYGRRKIVSLWQEADLRETPGLPPCAFLTIWNVRGEFLDMVLVQRSGDMLTASGAGGINEIQYAALLMMIARVTGYEPGVFSHFVANEQIYDRHIDNAHEMLRRAEEMEAGENAASGNTVAGNAAVGDTVAEDAAVGDAVARNATAGNTVAGDAAVGDAVTEDADAEKEAAEDAAAGSKAESAAKGSPSASSMQPRLVLHKESGCEFTDITLDDFEMADYAPVKPQLKFDLGI